MMNEDDQEKLLLMTTALFAVRLFRETPGGQLQRQIEAKNAALDAAAILAAVAEIST